MSLRRCKCGAKPREYEFGIHYPNCGLATRWFANHGAAVTAWNLGVDLIRRRIKPSEEIYAK